MLFCRALLDQHFHKRCNHVKQDKRMVEGNEKNQIGKEPLPDSSALVSSNLFINNEDPGKDIKFMLLNCFFSSLPIGLNPKPDVHVLTESGIADKTNILTLYDLSIYFHRNVQRVKFSI